jgi:hypothetical protein
MMELRNGSNDEEASLRIERGEDAEGGVETWLDLPSSDAKV